MQSFLVGCGCDMYAVWMVVDYALTLSFYKILYQFVCELEFLFLCSLYTICLSGGPALLQIFVSNTSGRYGLKYIDKYVMDGD